jgi:hypothetical protein
MHTLMHTSPTDTHLSDRSSGEERDDGGVVVALRNIALSVIIIL